MISYVSVALVLWVVSFCCLIRNYVGDILRKVGVLPPLKKSYYIEIPPID